MKTFRLFGLFPIRRLRTGTGKNTGLCNGNGNGTGTETVKKAPRGERREFTSEEREEFRELSLFIRKVIAKLDEGTLTDEEATELVAHWERGQQI